MTDRANKSDHSSNDASLSPNVGSRAAEMETDGHMDPFDPAVLRVSHTSDEALGIEKPLLVVPVGKPNKQQFFRANPDPLMRLDTRIIELKDQREVYLVTPQMAQLLPGETKLVRLTPCLPRQGGIFLWPVPLPMEDQRDNLWHTTARCAAEIAEKCWVRMQANMSMGAYDVAKSEAIPDPVWPNHTLKELLKVAFGGGRLIDRPDHPVIRQLTGKV